MTNSRKLAMIFRDVIERTTYNANTNSLIARISEKKSHLDWELAFRGDTTVEEIRVSYGNYIKIIRFEGESFCLYCALITAREVIEIEFYLDVQHIVITQELLTEWREPKFDLSNDTNRIVAEFIDDYFNDREITNERQKLFFDNMKFISKLFLCETMNFSYFFRQVDLDNLEYAHEKLLVLHSPRITMGPTISICIIEYDREFSNCWFDTTIEKVNMDIFDVACRYDDHNHKQLKNIMTELHKDPEYGNILIRESGLIRISPCKSARK